ncbi:MAG: bifunctional serine/threonine protein kinase/MFS transporter [Deltaproteobacteria bacterium]
MPSPGQTISPLALQAAAFHATLLRHGPEPAAAASTPATLSRPLPHISVAGEDGGRGLPDFELAGLLGEGGMGRVDAAVQLVFGRTVAVKRVRPDRMCVSAVLALVQEAAVTGMLDHPSIVPAYAFGQSFGGDPLLVMKRVEGASWTSLIHDEKHPAWERDRGDRLARHLEVRGKVCQAVESAHRRGVVHRDIKPDNVMIGDLGEVYVLDWGVAVRLSEPRSTDLAGTPAYMAPEMLGGSIDVTPRTDVYLLGAMLHEVLTGKPRHEGDAIWAVLAAVHESGPFEYDAAIPRELAAICNRAMARDPGERYPGALALGEAIGDFIRHRGSLDLTTEALRMLGDLRVAAGASATAGYGERIVADQSRATVRRLAAEADFAFRQALRSWPENPAADAGRQQCLEVMIGFEIDQRNAPGAEALLNELRLERPTLTSRVTALRAEIAEDSLASAKLAARDHEGDLAISARDRVGALIFTFTALGATMAALALLGGTLSRAGFLATLAVVGALYGSLLYGRREKLLATLANRRLAASWFLLFAWGVLITAVGWLSGTGIDAVVTTYFLGFVLMVCHGAVWTEGVGLYLLFPAFAAIALLSLWPGHTLFAFSAFCFAGALAALPRVFERQSRS